MDINNISWTSVNNDLSTPKVESKTTWRFIKHIGFFDWKFLVMLLKDEKLVQLIFRHYVNAIYFMVWAFISILELLYMLDEAFPCEKQAILLGLGYRNMWTRIRMKSPTWTQQGRLRIIVKICHIHTHTCTHVDTTSNLDVFLMMLTLHFGLRMGCLFVYDTLIDTATLA